MIKEKGILFILIVLLISFISAQDLGLTLTANYDSSQSQIIATIKNIDANPQASYDVYAICTNGFSQVGSSQRVSGLQISSSEIIYIQISGGTSNGNCDVKVTDVNLPTNTLSVRVPVLVSSSAIKICDEGDKSVLGNDIQECQNNAWITINTCISTEKVLRDDNGKPYCGLEKNKFNFGILIYIFIASLIVFVIIWVRHFNSKKKK